MEKIKWGEYAVHDDKSIKGFFGDYRWMSNFHRCVIKDELGIMYPSTEHAYQAAKSLDPEVRKQCLNMTCRQAKNWGQDINLRDDWETNKIEIMGRLNTRKFFNHADLANKLLATGHKYLEETNHWKDKFWGVYYKDNVGENHLGKVLMSIRNHMRLIIAFRSHRS